MATIPVPQHRKISHAMASRALGIILGIFFLHSGGDRARAFSVLNPDIHACERGWCLTTSIGWASRNLVRLPCRVAYAPAR